MPDAANNFKGIATTGKAGEVIERIFQPKPTGCPFDECCQTCPASEDDDVCLEDE
jgi:hypothetical protein